MPRFYLTTPIYYVNDVPHIGHAYTTVTADALARWHRLIGDEVFFLTGTDEHGLKVARSAEEHGCTPQEWADRTSRRFVEAWQLLGISNDDFIRTTERRHHLAVSSFLQRIYDNGHIYPGTWRGLYCVACEAYYGDDEQVEGACPIHGTQLEPMEEENYFFALSKFADPLLEHYAAHPEAVRPSTKLNEAVGFIRQGLRDISITRTSISWGVPAPWDSGHVVYVWYDALVNYLTAIGYGSDPERFASWWPASHHLLGKDIIRFHAVWWPAMCMAAGIDPPHREIVHGWLLVGGEKMSKSKLNQIFPADLAAEFGVDALRYHLLRDNGLGPDGDFTYEGMVERYNADLANNFGNLLSRVATVVGSACGGIGPAPDPSSDLGAVADSVVKETAASWDRFSPNEALEATWRLISATNAALEAAEPWKMAPGPEVDRVLGDALEVLRIVALLASPAMPSTCEELYRRIGMAGSPLQERLADVATWGGYPGGRPVVKGQPLFPRKKA
jgi:methionyl-tRNA synthetase